MLHGSRSGGHIPGHIQPMDKSRTTALNIRNPNTIREAMQIMFTSVFTEVFTDL